MLVDKRLHNEALLRTGTRHGFREGPSGRSCDPGVLSARSRVPVAEVGRSLAR